MGDLTKFITSGSRSWKNYYSTKGSLFIRSQNIKSESLEFSKKSYVKLPDKVEGKRTSVLENDILITITGAGVSNSGIINDVFWEEAYVSQHVALIRLVESKLAKWVHLSIISENVGKLQFKDLIYGDKWVFRRYVTPYSVAN